MADPPIALSPTNPPTRAVVAAFLVLTLTSVHHAYGAAIYGTPWRLHVVPVAALMAIGIATLLYTGRFWGRRLAGRLATWAGVATILAVPVAAIGLFEGGYNHILKNIVYFGLGESAAMAMFPPPAYEMPNDLVFELTGIAQFPLAIFAAALAVRLLRRTRG